MQSFISWAKECSKLNKAVIIYSEKGLAFGDEHVLAFDNIRYLDLQGITVLGKDEQQKHISFYELYDKYIEKFNQLLLMRNENIDEIIMIHKLKSIFPQPNCRHLKLVINSNGREKALYSVIDFIKKIPKRTKVHLMILFTNYQIYNSF